MRFKQALWTSLLISLLTQVDVAFARPQCSSGPGTCLEEVILDPTMIAPSIDPTGGNSDISIDTVGRIHFKTQTAVARYFDSWQVQDDHFLPRNDLMNRVLSLAYGAWWQPAPPTVSEVNQYRRDMNRKLWLLAVPTVSFGTTNVLGSSLVVQPLTKLPVPFIPPATSPVTINANVQTVYSLSWKISDTLLSRPSTKETVEAHLANDYKMRSEALKAFVDSYTARRTAQRALRSYMIEILGTPISNSDRVKDLVKLIDTAKSEIMKSDTQIDMMADDAAAKSYKLYADFNP
jgi:hypothetical protein